jgi:hypothetical protein
MTIEFWRFTRPFDDTLRANAITCRKIVVSDDSVDMLTEPEV